jgi:hypothetical protein
MGSQWLRWDPHLHTPGTLLGDQFGGNWDRYFESIAAAQPAPSALGITDYFTLRGYKEFVARRPKGSIPSLAYVFPNIELRLTVETERRNGINLHLLVASEDPEHVIRMEEKLSHLVFPHRSDRFPCTDDGLRRLGLAHRGSTLNAEQAIQEGANQFKVEWRDVQKLFDGDAWMKSNVLIAIAAGQDGLGGLSRAASMRALREELGRFADVVFSAQATDRAFWLGNHPDFAATGLRVKPCLHGSDAHRLEMVLQPHLDRRCWILGGPTFESLRQTLVEPERRVHIGALPPAGAPAGEVIARLQVNEATWLKTPDVAFNPGLVTIIGAKGSGKTALADLVAFAAAADELVPGPASFIGNARALLGDLQTDLTWADGARQLGKLTREPLPPGDARVRYLSQQFVERLSAPTHDLGEPLVQEIERVVFGAIPDEERLTAATFAELRDTLLEEPASSRAYEDGRVRTLTDVIAADSELIRSLPRLSSRTRETERIRLALEKAIRDIPASAGKEKVKAHELVATALQELKEAIAGSELRAKRVSDVKAAVQRQVRTADESWRTLKEAYPGLLEDVVWESLKPQVPEASIDVLTGLEKEARDAVDALRKDGLKPDPATPDKPTGGLDALTSGVEELRKELGLDELKAKQKFDLEKRLVTAKADQVRASRDLENAQKARGRIAEAQTRRLDSYRTIFETLVLEDRALKGLYAPLRERVAADPRLSKLAFVVGRVVDLDDWVTRGETIVDLRRMPYRGHGGLSSAASSILLPAWRSGSPEEVRASMADFIEKHAQQALQSLAQGFTPLDYGQWLFSTNHIRVQYGILYEGVEIARLSTGTRGVVLLTLYLGLDQWDIRPLVIDQPEENLDPSSVQDDLVPFFREAALRRQIIMVTHNANLVVNTDSDQVIVATSHRISTDSLPDVTYVAGGLEDGDIRDQVCRLLEGGEDAFRKRGERYGIAAVKR